MSGSWRATSSTASTTSLAPIRRRRNTFSRANLILATDAMVKLVGGETRRVIPVHEEALAQVYPHRVTQHGLRIIELALADGQASLVA